MDVYWFEQIATDVPDDNNWLSAAEVARLSSLRFAKRRADWRLGRWTAKNAVAAWLAMPTPPQVLARIEIRPAPSGAPEVFIADKPGDMAISLSHRDGRSACAVAPSGVEVGCDLEVIEPHSAGFVSDYFTIEEQALIAHVPEADRPRVLALLWSAKESALKALRVGLRLDTRSVIVTPDSSFDRNSWSPLQVRCVDGRTFHGWWQHWDRTVRCLVSDPPPSAPIRLEEFDWSHDRIYQCA